MNTAKIEQITLEFEITGSAQPVVLIHGSIVADAYLPLTTQRPLAHGYQLVRYRRRGFMGSSHAPPASIEDQANDCLGLMRHLGVAKAHVVGHSYGGVIASQLTLAAPEVVHSLTLMEPAFVWMVPNTETAALESAFAHYQAGNKREAVDAFMSGVSGPGYSNELENLLPGAFEAAVADADTFFQVEMPALMKFGENFSAERLRRIKKPVLAMVGRNSVPLFPAIHDVILRTIAQAEALEIPGAGHMLQIENPTAVAEGLAEFFSRHPIQ
ncbi:MAG: dehH1 2 [Candidatus Binatus sp.]|jgi:pimeloyl-ACP methyl ester carboxylesterase|nr:dehH1 2 [Candidatus Binatus sp.]